jgi:hypothetical protein
MGNGSETGDQGLRDQGLRERAEKRDLESGLRVLSDGEK